MSEQTYQQGAGEQQPVGCGGVHRVMQSDCAKCGHWEGFHGNRSGRCAVGINNREFACICDGYEPIQEELPKESFFQKHYADPPTMASIQRQLDAQNAQLKDFLAELTELNTMMQEAVAVMEDARRVVRGIAGMRS